MKARTRRELLGAIGLTAGACVFSSCLEEEQRAPVSGVRKPQPQWNYIKLNPTLTAHRVYTDFPKGHCMYTVFSSVVGQMAEIYGEPYSHFPLDMMKYGAGGVSEWGSLCGAMNGSAALIGLFVKSKVQRIALTNEVFLWYEQSALPVYKPVKSDSAIEIPTSTADSVLCHISVSKWCKVSGHKASSKAKIERCRRLSSDTAAITVEILNAWHDKNFAAVHGPTNQLHTCNSCHGRGGELENTLSKMNCTTCHTKLSDQHP